ncbi:glycosyltransferase family 2 protein [Peribacillus frigoritolerans]|uniref:Glycosyltransferase n=1 Tax=Peribacillus frigoritolerans TaxID=450367 RepID=A0AAJ1QN78_9BACI|nr:glycosyltransferase family 2 protein [Peribacillus frigoritolerans]MDM5284686.1 glycosyltransferase [Peribacillus frigoritolerans]
MKFSIIIRCYNKLSIVKKCVEAAVNSTDSNTEIILVNNHPPYNDVTEYLNYLQHPRIKVLDPMSNIGNAKGFNFGAIHAKGEFLVNLDDDIIVPNNDWINAMSKPFDDFPDLAYVSLAWNAVNYSIKDQVTQGPEYKQNVVYNPDYTIYFVSIFTMFGCVMIKKNIWKKYFANVVQGDLYGIDGYYQQQANALGMKAGYLLSHEAEHLVRTKEADFLYGAYKVLYAFKLLKQDYPSWRSGKSKLTKNERQVLKQFGYKPFEVDKMERLLSIPL